MSGIFLKRKGFYHLMQKSKRYCFVILTLAMVLFVNGCVSDSANSQTGEKELTTTITPARDLTGEWEGLPGSAKWHDNVANWACSYEGYIHLSLRQNGNALAGTFQATITKVIPNSWNTGKVPCSSLGAQSPAPLTGTVSSSSFKFKMYTIVDSTGSFTTDTLQGTFESCPNQICADGSRATGSIGEFKLSMQR